MKVDKKKLPFITANFVGRACNYSLKPFDWGKADEATQRLFQSYAFEKEFSELMTIIADAGFKTIELWTAHLNYGKATQEQIQKAKQILERYELSVYSYSGSLGNSEKELDQSFTLAQTMGAKILAGGFDTSLLDKAYKLCQGYKIRFAFENHPNRETPEKIKDTIGNRGDWFGACVDTGWFATYDIDASEAIIELQNNLFHIHLKDITARGKHETCALGDGIVDIPAVIKTLRKIDYDGCISIEHEPEYHDPINEIKKSLGRLYQWLES